MLPPLVIYKGKGLYRGWFTEVDDQNAKFAHSNKGYMTDKLAIEWVQAFDMATKERARGQPRFLLMDNYRTHYSLKMIGYAVENNITMMSYPGNSTHLLQPLDVCAYGGAVAEHVKKTRTGVTRGLFGVFLLEHGEIKASWRKAGIVPYNLDNVLNQLSAATTAAVTAAPNPPIGPKALAALNTSKTARTTAIWMQQRSYCKAGFHRHSKKVSRISFLDLRTRLRLDGLDLSYIDKIELSDIRTTYAGKKAPKGRRKKLTTTVIADAGYLLQKEREAEEKERVERSKE